MVIVRTELLGSWIKLGGKRADSTAGDVAGRMTGVKVGFRMAGVRVIELSWGGDRHQGGDGPKRPSTSGQARHSRPGEWSGDQAVRASSNAVNRWVKETWIRTCRQMVPCHHVGDRSSVKGEMV